MSLSPNQLVATNVYSTQVSCAIANANGCNLSVASGGGTLNATMTQDLSPSSNPQFVNVTATGQVNASGLADSTSTITGAIITVGGMGIEKNVTVGGQIHSTDTIDSTSTTTGAIITAGGMGIAKNISCGGGINFGNGTLSNYRTPQSWTPILSIGGSTTGITYSNQSGTVGYFGNLVMCSFAMNLTSMGTSRGNVTLNLPYTCSSAVQPVINVGAWGNLNLDVDYTQLSLSPTPGTSYAYFYQSATSSNLGFTNLTSGNLPNNPGIWGNIWFFI